MVQRALTAQGVLMAQGVFKSRYQVGRAFVFSMGLVFGLSLGATAAHAAVLGHFEHVHNGPGYIELNEQSPLYESPYTSKQQDGIERRTPSKILLQDYIQADGFINLNRIEQHQVALQEWLRGSFIAYCSNATNRGTTVFDCRHRFGRHQDPVNQQWARTQQVQTALLVIDEFERAATLSHGLNFLPPANVNSPGAQKFLETLFQAIELQHALYNEWEDKGFRHRLSKNKNSKAFIISKQQPSIEAVNLRHPQSAAEHCTVDNVHTKGDATQIAIQDTAHDTTQIATQDTAHAAAQSSTSVFYGPRDLLQHPDASLLDPISSGFWRRPEKYIESFDTTNYNHELRTALGPELFEKIKHIEQPTSPMQLTYAAPVAEGKVPQFKARYKEFEFNLKLTITPPVQDEPAKYSELVANFYRHGSQVRSQFVASNLAAALGFTVSPAYYKREVQLFFDEDAFEASLAASPEGQQELNSRFLKARKQAIAQLSSHVFADSLKSHTQGPFMWDYIAAFRDTGVVAAGPQQGRHFVRLKTVSLELLRVNSAEQNTSFRQSSPSLQLQHASPSLTSAAQDGPKPVALQHASPAQANLPQTRLPQARLPQANLPQANLPQASLSKSYLQPSFVNWRVGRFHKYTLGKHLKREFRAFLVFYLWLSDRDVKDAHSSLGIVRQGPQGEVKVFYTADEMGRTLGGVFADNKPNFLSYNMVEKLKGGLHFFNWDSAHHHNPAFQSITWADVKWVARLMAQLTENQIRDSFLAADYPAVVAELYTQKLLRRRDQLVEAVGLDGEWVLPCNSYKTEDAIEKSRPQQADVRWADGPFLLGRRISSNTSHVPDDPQDYFAPSCQDCFYKGELVQMPEGVQTDENFTLSMRRYPKGIIRKSGDSRVRHMTQHALARILGRYASKITYGVDWTMKSMGAAVGTWLPSRYLVENPFDNPERPFWVVDSFYMYAGLGWSSPIKKTRFWPKPDKKKLLQRFLSGSLDLKTYLRAIGFLADHTSLGKHVFQLFEFVRVKPVGYKQGAHNLSDVIKIYNPKKIVGVHMGGLKRHFVEGLDEGDFLVSSRHTVMRGSTRLQSPIWKPMFELDFVPAHIMTDRIVLYKKDPHTVIMHWLDSDRRRMYLEVDFETLLFELPIGAKRTDHAHGRERTYSFNVSDPKQEKLVVDYLDRDVPKDIPKKYLLEDSQIGDHIQGMRLSFFGLGSKKMQNRLLRARIKDNKDKVLRNFVVHSKNYRKQPWATHAHARLHTSHRDRGVSSYVDLLTGDMMVKVDLFMEKLHAQRQHFSKMRNAFRGMIPSVMLQFDDRHVNYYLGTLSFEGRVLLSSQALQHIFEAEQTPNSLCHIYATYTRVVWGSKANTHKGLHDQVDQFCDYALRKWPIERASDKGLSFQARRASQQREMAKILVGVHWFISHFLKAQKKYKKFKALWAEYEKTGHDKKSTRQVRGASVWMAKALTDLFKVEPTPGARHLALMSMAPVGSMYREAFVKSSHDALPGGQHTLALAETLKGDAALKDQEFWHMADGNELISATIRPALVALTPFFIEQKLKAFINMTPVGYDILNSLEPGLRQLFYNKGDDKLLNRKKSSNKNLNNKKIK